MNGHRRALAAAALATLAQVISGCTQSHFATGIRTISVWGQGEARARPDRFVLRVSVTHVDPNLEAARERVTHGSQALLRVLQEFDIDEPGTKTTDYDVNRHYEGRSDDRTFVGFRVQHTLEITLNDPSQAEGLTAAVLTAGATQISSAKFESSRQAALFSEARRAALRNARTEAEVLAAALGQRIGLPLRIGAGFDSDEDYYSHGDSIFGDSDVGVETSWATPQEVGVDASVRVVFALE